MQSPPLLRQLRQCVTSILRTSNGRAVSVLISIRISLLINYGTKSLNPSKGFRVATRRFSACRPSLRSARNSILPMGWDLMIWSSLLRTWNESLDSQISNRRLTRSLSLLRWRSQLKRVESARLAMRRTKILKMYWLNRNSKQYRMTQSNQTMALQW